MIKNQNITITVDKAQYVTWLCSQTDLPSKSQNLAGVLYPLSNAESGTTISPERQEDGAPNLVDHGEQR